MFHAHRNLVTLSGMVGLMLIPVSAEATQIAVSVMGPGTITKPGASVYRGSFSPDGRQFYFFRKVAADREDYRIFVSRRVDGGWSEPDTVRLGAGGLSDLYPTLSPDGSRLVFTSYRPVPGDTSSTPNANLWYVERAGDGWSEPRFLAAASTTANYDAGPWFDLEGALHFVSTSPDWRTTWHRVISRFDGPPGSYREDRLLDPWSDWRADAHVWHATPSPDGRLVVLDVSEIQASGRRAPSDLWVAARDGSGWRAPVRLGPEVNTPDAYENFVAFTPDGTWMCFARGFAGYHCLAVADLRSALP